MVLRLKEKRFQFASNGSERLVVSLAATLPPDRSSPGI
jgi:hypothetical protein